MPLNLEEFSREQLQGYIETVPPQREYMLRALLPEEQAFDINFAYGVVNGKYGDSASITGWNASAPLRDKKEIEKAFGEVSKVQHGIRLDEKELLAFNRPRSEGERGQVIEYVYTSTDELSQGVDDIAEYMRAKAVYDGTLVYEDKVNDISIDVDFGIPEANVQTVTNKWGTPEATPLEDLQGAIKQYKKENQRRNPVTMHMSSATESALLKSEQIRNQVYGTQNGQRLLTPADVQNAFLSLGIPNYAINDDVIVVNGVEEQLLADNKVVILGDNLGNTMVGPTVENNYNPGKFVLPKIQTDPPGQTVIVGESLFPALKKPKSIVIVNV